MKIAIIGAGYVGLVTALCFSDMGHNVVCVDTDIKKVKSLKEGKTPIYEKRLDELLEKHLNKNFKVTSDLSDAMAEEPEAIFIAVGTPSDSEGRLDLSYVKKAAIDIAKYLDFYSVIVMKSTVLPGSTESLVPIIEKESKRKLGSGFGLAMNPEFLKEGTAVEDFMKPDRIVIGYYDEKSRKVLEEIYTSITAPKIFTDIKTAEMIKYASNVFLAARVSLINEIGNICKQLGIDVYEVAEAVGLDKRIGPYFLRAGVGFGGSCFPKDIMALINKSKEIGENADIMEAIVKVNDRQPLKILQLALQKFPNLHKKRITVLGLAFKADTDDIRESRAVPLIEALLSMGADVTVYDPLAMQNFKKQYNYKIKYAEDLHDALKSADICFIMTDWAEFKKAKDYENVYIFDGRNLFRRLHNYEGICW
ncbi:UDP-glucose 6-dehydrogenase [Candidatus Micrarchaeota archaeon]|nr:MAG: UDP-glucose 6-dehydrogenase [Candidatus Micrarchaeota archaeon]